ncbi:hypothetical protein EAD98_11265 [Micromonospora sp. CV4]|nr:hypothetical protein EAD98_11265 [Micromonospora sp. CV4]
MPPSAPRLRRRADTRIRTAPRLRVPGVRSGPARGTGVDMGRWGQEGVLPFTPGGEGVGAVARLRR